MITKFEINICKICNRICCSEKNSWMWQTCSHMVNVPANVIIIVNQRSLKMTEEFLKSEFYGN